jgi:hypothetical protein
MRRARVDDAGSQLEPVEVVDGTSVPGLLCQPIGLCSSEDITPSASGVPF